MGLLIQFETVGPTICRCCAEPMSAPSSSNPNICLDCERLAFDESAIGGPVVVEVFADRTVLTEAGNAGRPSPIRQTGKDPPLLA